jgi:hypothetical protein
MNRYAIALFLHLLSLLLATMAASLSTFAALRLRQAETADDAEHWLSIIGSIVRAFPVAVLGLLGSGSYMVRLSWTWSTPWIDAALVGLTLIVMLGSGIEASRSRVLQRELQSAGLSSRARRLLRDPVVWSAKVTTLTLVVAVVFVMTLKPMVVGSATAIIVAVVVGVLGAVPLWRGSRVTTLETAREPASPAPDVAA